MEERSGGRQDHRESCLGHVKIERLVASHVEMSVTRWGVLVLESEVRSG